MSKILVVEDDHDLGNLVKIFCESNGFECFLSRTGKEAIEICEKNKIDIIVFDYLLEDMTVDKVLDQIQLQLGCKRIFLDGWNMEFEGKIDFEYDVVIEKPFLLNDLLLKINHLMVR